MMFNTEIRKAKGEFGFQIRFQYHLLQGNYPGCMKFD